MPLPPATEFRPWWLKGLNAALPRLWDRGLLPPPDLAESTIDAMARRAAGCGDPGDDGFARTQLRALLPALEGQAAINPFGRMIAHGSLVKIFKDRLRAEALFERHPEILERPVPTPLVIVGQARSGTTRLHRLLAADRRFLHLRLFEAMSPVPWSRSRRHGRDPRAFATARLLGRLQAINPGLAAAHPTGALEPDEEIGLLELSVSGPGIEAQRRVPDFARHLERTDQTPAYAYLRRLLQLIGWFRGDDPAMPWLLKTPQHMQDLTALLSVFPDARIVFTHRDAAAVVASSASLVWNQMVVQSDEVDPCWIGAEWLHKTALRAEIAAVARQDIAPGQALDLGYREVEADWEGALSRIYCWLRLPAEPALPALRAVVAETAARPRHAAHRYDLADFGLNAARVRALVPDYRDAPALLSA